MRRAPNTLMRAIGPPPSSPDPAKATAIAPAQTIERTITDRIIPSMLNKPYLNTDSAAAMLIADAPEEEAMGGPTTIAPGNVAIGSMTIGAEFTAIGAEEAIGSGVGSGVTTSSTTL